MKTKALSRKIHFALRCFAAAALAACLVFSSGVFAPPAAYADTLDELERRYEEIERQREANEQKKSEVEQSKQTQAQKVEALESEIGGLNDQIGILDNRINILNANISDLNSSIASLDAQIRQIDDKIASTRVEITDTEQKIDDTSDMLLERLAMSYMMGDASVLEFVLGAKSLAGLLTLNQYIENATKYDKTLISGLELDAANLESLKATLESEIETLEESKQKINEQKIEFLQKQSDVKKSVDDLDNKKGTLEKSRSSAVDMMKSLDKQSAEFAKIERQLAQEQEKVDRQINEFLASQGSNSSSAPTNDGSLIWPMPYPNCYISAPFGQYPSGGPHKGLDICVHGGTYGKDIVAAQSGTVIQMGYGHWSMGNYVILDHGGGLFTAYYHASTLKVSSTGQTVSQGQVIALAGETGNATGPHLHFEVRVNRNGTVTQVNPMNYYSAETRASHGV